MAIGANSADTGNQWDLAVHSLQSVGTGARLTMTYRLFPGDTTLSIDGIDWPGVFAYMTRLLARFELSYDVYVGVRGHTGQGSRCELPSTPDTWTQMRRMYEYVRQNPGEFRPRPPVVFDCVYKLSMRLPVNTYGLLCGPTAYWAERDINVRSVRAERDYVGEALGRSAVRVSATLEAPGRSVNTLERDLRDMCSGARVKLREVWRRSKSAPDDPSGL